MTTPSPHLDLDALADALAGEGTEADATHLAGCGDCAGRLGELRAADQAVGSRLGTLDPPALPPDVAARLDAALAGQQPLGRPRPASVTALPASRARRSAPGWLPAAAAAVLVFGGAGAAVTLAGSGLQGGSDDSSTAAAESAEGAAGAADTGASDLLLTASGEDWADPATPATALPRVLGGQLTSYQLDDAGRTRSSEAAAAAESQGDDPAVASEDGDEPQPASAAPDELPDGDAELDRLRTTEGLEACLSSLLAEDPPYARPLAVDYARYDGRPALAVVLPDPDPTQAAVFVVGADCSAADPDLLLFRRAPLP